MTKPVHQQELAFKPTHVVTADTALYTTGPQQGRPPDAILKAGTKVKLNTASGSYSLVSTMKHLSGYVVSSSLKSLSHSIPVP